MSRGLQMQVKSSEDSLTRDLKVPLPESEPFQTLSILLRVLAELPPQKDAGTIEHKVSFFYIRRTKSLVLKPDDSTILSEKFSIVPCFELV
jgi:hypothetical protein